MKESEVREVQRVSSSSGGGGDFRGLRILTTGEATRTLWFNWLTKHIIYFFQPLRIISILLENHHHKHHHYCQRLLLIMFFNQQWWYLSFNLTITMIIIHCLRWPRVGPAMPWLGELSFFCLDESCFVILWAKRAFLGRWTLLFACFIILCGISWLCMNIFRSFVLVREYCFFLLLFLLAKWGKDPCVLAFAQIAIPPLSPCTQMGRGE